MSLDTDAAAQTRRCTCPLWGSGDAQGCFEVQEYGHTPVIRAGDVLDGVIVVEHDDYPWGECECPCHED